jgi:hypothetical protein
MMFEGSGDVFTHIRRQFDVSGFSSKSIRDGQLADDLVPSCDLPGLRFASRFAAAQSVFVRRQKFIASAVARQLGNAEPARTAAGSSRRRSASTASVCCLEESFGCLGYEKKSFASREQPNLLRTTRLLNSAIPNNRGQDMVT